jgi:hypothetical protein
MMDMKKEKTISILTHPFFIGLFVSALILAVTIPVIPRYKVSIKDVMHYGSNIDIFLDDLDGDNESEEINVDWTETMVKVMVFKGPLLIEQYNLRSQPIPGHYYFAGDYNRDGSKELYFFSRNHDSILLSIIDPLVKKDFLLKDRLIFYNDTIHYNLDMPEITAAGFIDNKDWDNCKVIFSITSGFSKRPRAVYLYDFPSDTLLVSPKSAATVNSAILSDLTGDSIPEIILSVSATGNYEMEYPFRDYSAWLMVLDQQLNFHFPPLEFPGFPSTLVSLPFYYKDSTYIVTLHEYYGTDNYKSGLCLFTASGKLIRSRELEMTVRNNYRIVTDAGKQIPYIYLINEKEHMASRISFDLTEDRTTKLPDLSIGNYFTTLDVEGDGIAEFIFLGEKIGTVVVFRHDFKHPLTIDLNEDWYPEYVLSMSRNGKNLLYLHFHNIGYLLKYGPNPLYFAKFPLSAAVYVLISLLLSLIYRIQRFRTERQYQTQKKIGELQILSLKNQIDPHLTFNILNSLGHLYTDSDLKEKAYDIFVKYSRLLRKAVENSHKISINLIDELEFVRSYIELEQLRSDHSFTSSIDIEEGVDLNITIPRMLIHTFVENAIKHGIRQRVSGSGAELRIRISNVAGHYKITILDNGPGLINIPESRPFSTGRGLQIIREIVDLYYTLKGARIEYETSPLQIEEDNQKWTRVIIKVPKQ